MTFPLYNECPNCGHKVSDHVNYPGWCSGDGWTEETVSTFGFEMPVETNCKCPLSAAEVNQAISIQAAVEVALQRAAK